MRRTSAVALVVMAVTVIFIASPAHAQTDTDAVFIHGLFAGSGSWSGTAGSIASNLQIASHVPDPAWYDSFEDQVGQVEGSVGSLSATALGVGHSNGGLVARLWSRDQSLGAILTYATPHGGAPLAHYFNWADYNELNFDIGSIVDSMLTEILDCDTDSYECDYGGADYFLTTSGVAMGELADAAMESVIDGIDSAYIFAEMEPGSDFLDDLNSGGSVSTENSHVAIPFGIVSVAHNYYYGGILRAADPGDGDALWYARDAAEAEAYGTAYGIIGDGYSDSEDLSLASQLLTWGDLLGSMDDWWCGSVSTVEGYTGECDENDTIVPTWSQAYWLYNGSAGGIEIDDGPAHNGQETADYSTVAGVMLDYLGISYR